MFIGISRGRYVASKSSSDTTPLDTGCCAMLPRGAKSWSAIRRGDCFFSGPIDLVTQLSIVDCAALRCSGPGVAELGRSLSATRQRAAAGAACGCVCVVLEMS
jgi:hypothetical protein